jgi:shikimate dehydrogenase
MMDLDGRTRLVGIIGWPVEHSLSPRMHNAAFEALGLNYAYVPLPVRPERVEAAVRGLEALGFAGANVTVPHKGVAMRLADELSAAARAIGAVNTLIVGADGKIQGDNTDVYGFTTSLAECGWPPETPSNCRAVVIGAGGAARAVTYGLLEMGVSVAVANRSFEKAVLLCRSIGLTMAEGESPPADRLSPHRFPDDLASLASNADLVVNATSLGLHGSDDPLPWDPNVSFRPDQTVYDLVPRPGAAGPTPFLALAAASGANAVGGLGMLVHQGARSFELWTGAQAPVQTMRDALE